MIDLTVDETALEAVAAHTRTAGYVSLPWPRCGSRALPIQEG